VRRVELEDERTHLLDSLVDLERERAAGDLSEDDYRTLRDRYVGRAARVLRALDDAVPGVATGSPAPPDAHHHDAGTAGAPPRRRRRRWLAVGGALAVAAAVALLFVSTQASSRLPGQSSTGTVRLSPAQQLAQLQTQAETLEAEGHDAEAVALYHRILASRPDDADALAELGWLEFQAGVAARNATVITTAETQEQQAARLAPGDDAPHLYLGSMLLADGDAPAAADQFRQFLADRPAPATVRQAWSFITQAYRRAGRPVPSFPSS